MDVRPVSESELKDWADFVAGSENATGFHAPGWLHILSQAFGVRPIFLRARDEKGSLVGVLPMFRSRSLLFGDFISTLEDGHCAADERTARALSRKALELLAEEKAGSLKYKTNFVEDVAREHGNVHDCQRVETIKTVVSTNIDSDKMFAALKEKTRWNVRKAKKRGFIVRDAIERLADFYPIYAANLHRLGTPVFGPAMFELMPHHLGKHVGFFALERDGKLYGGMVYLKARCEWTSLYFAVEEEAKRSKAGYLLQWTAFESAARNGIARFNLGRSTVGSGAHRYKLQWGGQDVLVPHYIFGPAAKREAERLQSATSEASLRERIWRKLPLPLANRLGSLLRRPLPFI